MRRRSALWVAVALLVCSLSRVAYAAGPLSFEDLSTQAQAGVTEAVSQAAARMAQDWEAEVTRSREMGIMTSGVLAVLHTTVYTVGELPDDATERQRETYAANYEGAAYLVRFTALVDFYGYDPPLMIAHPSIGHYRIGHDGEVEVLNLEHIASRTFDNPVLPGMAMIDCGDRFNEAASQEIGGRGGI